MLRRVTLRRFRGFAEYGADLGPLTAMIGRNSSGKTSILQAIRLAYSAAQLAVESEDSTPKIDAQRSISLCQKLVVTDPSRLIALADWKQIFTNAEVGEGIEASVRLVFDARDPVQAVEVSLIYGRNAQLMLSVDIESSYVESAVQGIRPKSKDRPPRIREALQRVLPMAVFVPAFYGVTRNEEYRTTPVIDRALGGGDQSHIVRNLVARLDGRALARMNGFLARTVGARIEDRTSSADADRTEFLAVTYVDTNGGLELSSAGAGLVSMIALWAALERTQEINAGPAPARSVAFLLDEPEAHMHPRLQGDLGERIAAAAAEYGVQLVIATHSVEMINRLGRQPEALLLSIDRSTATAAALTSEAELVRALDAFCDLSPYTSLSFLASRRVVFHEGPSDWKILDACARFYFRSDDAKRFAWLRYVPVPLDGVGNVSSHGVLAKLLTPHLFPTAVSGAKAVRAVLVRDRDASRTPAAPKLEKRASHFEAIDVVWSRYSIESLFLDADCLVAWLAPLELTTDEELRTKVIAAIAETDKDAQLGEDAFDRRERALLHPDPQGNVNRGAARSQARNDVRTAPEVWHPGRDRAKRILQHLRASLPGIQQRRLRGALDDLIEAADPNRLGDANVVLPPEIRALLDAMVA